MPGRRGLPAKSDLLAVVGASVVTHRRTLSKPRVGVHQRRWFGLVAVMPVRLDDLRQVLMQVDQLRGADGADVRVPDLAPVVVAQQCTRRQVSHLGAGEDLGLDAVRAVDLL